MRAYAEALFPGDYNPGTGVLEYRTAKDRLRDTGLTERDLADPDVAFFAARNPGWVHGHDLVCLTELSPANLVPAMVDPRHGRTPIGAAAGDNPTMWEEGRRARIRPTILGGPRTILCRSTRPHVAARRRESGARRHPFRR